MTNCYHCGDEDHLARECPRNKTVTQGTVASSRTRGAPATWCSYCDEATRLIDLGHSVQRCPNCHPLRFHALAQSRKCPACHQTVYEWDHAACGCHARPGEPLPRPATKGRPDSTRLEGAPGDGDQTTMRG